MNNKKIKKESIKENNTDHIDFDDVVFLEDILAFEQSLRDNPEQVNEWIDAKQAIADIIAELNTRRIENEK